MVWRDGLFLHWPVDPETIRRHVPQPLAVDTWEGRAWISVLPFALANAGFRGTPRLARLTFPELNVRTYVQLDGTSGLYFFAIDVGHPLVPAAAGPTRLPVYHVDATIRRDGGDRKGADEISFRSVRDDPPARFAATYRPSGEVFHADSGSLDHWLMERRRMYDPTGRRILYGEIAHDPWPLQPVDVTVEENTVLGAEGLPVPDGEPRARYAAELPMTGSVLRWLRSPA